MQKFLLLIKEIVNCNYPDGEKLQESNDRSVRLHQKPQKILWNKDKEHEATGKTGKGLLKKKINHITIKRNI